MIVTPFFLVSLAAVVVILLVGISGAVYQFLHRCSNEWEGCRHRTIEAHFSRGYCSVECKEIDETKLAAVAMEYANRRDERSRRPIVK